MKYLLDTHVVLWSALEPHKLSDAAKSILLDPYAPKYVSIVSAWEVALKLGTHKLTIDGGLVEFFRMTDENGFLSLGVEREYISLLNTLPLIHHDPFDRMLIATARAEDLILITIDENIRKYDVPRIW
ncbi:MAG: type II toxin-antitoxin system VapC family toxin [Synergistaceae bacterium]|jgi:PIN domain nuclease of toxin-antitoxin system|nr:type II toxin-antitoxin system VapC family toxin [Synergistaceae bacterium]